MTLLTEEEAAAIAKVSRKTIRRLIEQGRLPAADYGTAKQHNYRINADDLLTIQAVNEPAPIVRPRPIRHRRIVASPASSFLPRVHA